MEAASFVQQDHLKNTAMGGVLKPLSVVGYDRPELLYAAICDHNEHYTGRPLSASPSFGGHSGLTMVARHGAPSTFEEIVTHDHSAHGASNLRDQRRKIEHIAAILGADSAEHLNSYSDRQVYRALTQISVERLTGIALMLDVAQDMTGQNRGMILVEKVIPLIHRYRPFHRKGLNRRK